LVSMRVRQITRQTGGFSSSRKAEPESAVPARVSQAQ
jgi:hypothetical protein